MHKIHCGLLSLFFLALLGCEKNRMSEANTQKLKQETENLLATQQNIKDGSYCFIKQFNQDITEVKLVFAGDAITGDELGSISKR